MKAIVEAIGSLDSFAGHWMESAPLVGAIVAECLDLLAEQTTWHATSVPNETSELPAEVVGRIIRSRESQARAAGELRKLAEEARALASRPIPESFLLRVRSALRGLRHEQELERELLLDGIGWRDLGCGD